MALLVSLSYPHSIRRAGLGAVCALALAATFGCATPPADPPSQETAADASDPLESFNRRVFAFNRAVDEAFIEPVALIYRDTLPQNVRDAVRNLLRHLRSPITFANNVLQGDLVGANAVLARALVNTIAGFGGLADPAGDLGTPYVAEDFGQTLAVWGVGDGPYLVIPILGPSNVRDLTGGIVDSAADPVNIWLDNADHGEAIFARAGTQAIDFRSRNIELFDNLERTSVDYYATIRSLYRQRRTDEIHNGKPDDPAVTPTITFEGDEPGRPAAEAEPDRNDSHTRTSAADAVQTSEILPFIDLTVRRIGGDAATGPAGRRSQE